MGAETQDSTAVSCLARAIGDRMRLEQPHHTAKYVAQRLSCTPKAAANLLDGHLSSASVAKVIAAYGPMWVAERVLEAGGFDLPTFIENQAAEAERAVARARERAEEARRIHEKFEAARRASAGDHRPAA